MTSDPKIIDTGMDADGAVMMNAGHVVAWLRWCAATYLSGEVGGSPAERRAAHAAVDAIADGIESAYIDACANAATQLWDDRA